MAVSSRAARFFGSVRHLDRFCMRAAASAEIAAQHQRRRAAVVIALAPADFVEAGAPIERARPAHCASPTSRNTARVPSPAKRRRCRSSSGRASARPRQAGAIATDRISASPAASRDRIKPISLRAAHGAVGDDIAFDQQPVNLVLAPAALERGAVDGGDRRGVARPRLGESGRRRGRTGARRNPIIAAAARRRFAAARPARADIAASAALALPPRRRRFARPRRCRGHRAHRRVTGAGAVSGSPSATACAAEPTMRAGPRTPRGPLRPAARAAARPASGRPHRRPADRRAACRASMATTTGS